MNLLNTFVEPLQNRMVAIISHARVLMYQSILILILLLTMASRSQSQQFQFLYNCGDINRGVAIESMDGGYLTTHRTYNSYNGQTNSVIAKFDTEGNLQWNTFLSDSEGEFTFLRNNINILPGYNETNKWFIGGYRFFTGPFSGKYLPCFRRVSYYSQTLEEVILTELYDQEPIPIGGFRNGVNMYILCTNNSPNSSLDATVLKCDLFGQFIEQYLLSPDDDNYRPWCIVDVGEGFLVGARRNQESNSNFTDLTEQHVTKLNYDGEVQWTSVLSSPLASAISPVNFIPLNNGNYLFANTFHNANCKRPWIGELNSETGDTLWTKLYFDSVPTTETNLDEFNSINELLGFKRISDGGFIGVGMCEVDVFDGLYDGPLDNAAFMMKLDAEYNLLWKRVYIPEGYSESSFWGAHCWFNDFVEETDGSIVALGGVNMFTSYPITDSYMIRVDSLGCLVSGCTVGVKEYEPKQDLLIYPNPTEATTTIEFPSAGKWDVEVYDLKGTLVYQRQFNYSLKQQIDITFLPSGIYTIHCTQANKKHFVQKIVKMGE